MTDYTKAEEILRAENVQLSFGNRIILRDINFSIRNILRPGYEQGQVVSLVGRSGIGKTQLFKILSGLQDPGSGKVTINGNRTIRAGDMGVIFQNYYLFEWRSIHTSLMLAARQNKAYKGREREMVEKYLDEFGLKELRDYYPRQLSGGQRQRASIIQQLLKGSDFLLLDEPFSGLDVCVLDRVINLLLQVSLSDELKTLIIVSHDIENAVAISDTVFIMGEEEGKEGATIKKEIDLIDRGLAWQKDVRQHKMFMETIDEIRSSL